MRRLLRWFRKYRRHYPWRETRDPYRIFVAEFMLQRTGAQQVLPVYRKFIGRFPNLERAMEAKGAVLRETLRPLGRIQRYKIFQRALQHQAGKLGGKPPKTLGALIKVPGVGPYTARAILVFAHGRRLGLFDPNIYRVISRVFGVRTVKQRPHTDPGMWVTMDGLISQSRSREMNLALLDFAAAICRPKPRCPICPMHDFCDYYRRIGS